MPKVSVLLLTILAALASTLVPVQGSDSRPCLELETRIEVQAAIERAYHRHRTGTTAPFADKLTREVLERKVLRDLERESALERSGVIVTREMLDAEWERIRRHTHSDDRLNELTEALGNDMTLVRECLVLPVLVERLLRDPNYDSANDLSSGPVATGSFIWDNQSLDDPSPDAPKLNPRSPVVWTGSELLVFGGGSLYDYDQITIGAGGRYDPVLDHWTPISMVDAPRTRRRHSAVWTGEEMIVFGGKFLTDPPCDQVGTSSGGRYDPVLDEWNPIANAPTAFFGHTAVWTGEEMIVFGGLQVGASETCSCLFASTPVRYDPQTDSWDALAFEGRPSARHRHSAVWTGEEMIVWGGASDCRPLVAGDLADGGRYDPRTDSWTPITSLDAPSARGGHVAVWTGDRMVLWGGLSSAGPLASGGIYDPQLDSWAATSEAGAPTGRAESAVVWTGSRMIVWGGNTSFGSLASGLDTGGVFDPSTQTWEALPSVGAPAPAPAPFAAWTGFEMLIYHGDPTQFLEPGMGGRLLDPDIDDDGVPFDVDNCNYVSNADQSDVDDDGFGDACDNCASMSNVDQSDVDLDGVGDACDNCREITNPDQTNGDADPFGDACDNCPSVRNADQANDDGDPWGDVCDDCPGTVQTVQGDIDGDGVGDACDNCRQLANPDQFQGDVVHERRWADYASASSQWSETDWSADQATGPPDLSQCASAETNWTPLEGGPDPEWLELTYAFAHRPIGVDIYESGLESAFVRRIDLRDTDGALHTVWEANDTRTCGEVFAPRWTPLSEEMTGVVVYTETDGWEELDAVEMVWLGSPSADLAGSACDVCPFVTDDAQGDRDGDGVGDLCDCAPDDAQVHAPREIGGVTAERTTPEAAVRFNWPAASAADEYAVTRGLLSQLSTGHYGACVQTGGRETWYEDDGTPPADDGFVFLIQGVNAVCGTGTAGGGHDGAERHNEDPAACAR